MLPVLLILCKQVLWACCAESDSRHVFCRLCEQQGFKTCCSLLWHGEPRGKADFHLPDFPVRFPWCYRVRSRARPWGSLHPAPVLRCGGSRAQAVWQ